MASIFSQNKNHLAVTNTEYTELIPPAASLESLIATDVYYRALSAMAIMEEAGIRPGETVNISIPPAATELGATALRTEMSSLPSSPQLRPPLLRDVSDDNIATIQYI